jgi:hydrogenase expression/formation protein HypE
MNKQENNTDRRNAGCQKKKGTKMNENKRRMQLNCPMPKLDYDVITLGHGSGGVLTNRLLDDGVFDLFKNDLLDTRHDGAIFSLEGKLAFTTDSFVVSPISFPGGNIGELAVNGTVNDIAMCGAIPKYLSLAFIIEEGLSMQEFWDVLVSIKYAAEEAGVKIVTGDTKVVERGKGDKIFINTTGIGVLHPQSDIRTDRLEKGDKIFISGNIATHGMTIMSVREGLEFETTIQSDTQCLNHLIQELVDEFGDKIKFLRDPTRGGVGTTLTEIARSTKLGIEINEKDLPVLREVSAACEILGLDPLYVANEGNFLCFVSPDIEDSFLQKLNQHSKGENGKMIGEVVKDHPSKVILNSKIGGKRVVNMLVGEQLPRIC